MMRLTITRLLVITTIGVTPSLSGCLFFSEDAPATENDGTQPVDMPDMATPVDMLEPTPDLGEMEPDAADACMCAPAGPQQQLDGCAPDGSCAYVCEDGWRDCSEDAPGCETKIADTVEMCGACGAPVSCSFGAAEPHAMPSCEAGVCTPVCDDGWADQDDDFTNGCECAVDDSEDILGDRIDSNCDGVDGLAAQGVFVHKELGDDLAIGDRANPVASISRAMDIFSEDPSKRTLYLAATQTNSYRAHIVVEDRAFHISGGYNDTFSGTLQGATSEIEPFDPAKPVLALMGWAEEQGPRTVLSHITLRGGNASGMPSRPAVTVRLEDWAPGVSVRASSMYGGIGSPGRDGMVGPDGTDGADGNTPSAPMLSQGGAGGERACPFGNTMLAANGGRGGDGEACPVGVVDRARGKQGASGDEIIFVDKSIKGGAGGAGGFSNCDNLFADRTEAVDGDPGDPGIQRDAPTVSDRVMGDYDPMRNIWRPIRSPDGPDGSPGSGGGGGGGGVAPASANGSSAGGGGGSGGCGGRGGGGGTQGGASIAILVVGTSIDFDSMSEVHLGKAGDGGVGGAPGCGGGGGAGAPGASTPRNNDLEGAAGGAGGPGAPGIGGAGGHGGPSIGILLAEGASLPEDDMGRPVFRKDNARFGAPGVGGDNRACDASSDINGEDGQSSQVRDVYRVESPE